MNKLEKIPGILLRISPLFLGPILLLIPSPDESPFTYYELLVLFFVLAAAWQLVLSVGPKLTPELSRTKRFFFMAYLFAAVTAVLGCLTLMRERMTVEIFILLPAALAFSSARIFLKRIEKPKLSFLAEFLLYFVVGMASCGLYTSSLIWQMVVVSLAFAIQVFSSSLAAEISRVDKPNQDLLSIYSVCVSFPAVIIAALTYFRELPVYSLSTLAILAVGSRVIAAVRSGTTPPNLSFLTDLLGLGFVVLCLLSSVL